MYFDVTLPMGLCSSPFLFQRDMNAVRYLCQKEGYNIVNYLDDLGIAETWDKVEEEFSCLGVILSDCGIYEVEEKACRRHWLIIFLGILFNIRALTLEAAPDRLTEITELLVNWLS